MPRRVGPKPTSSHRPMLRRSFHIAAIHAQRSIFLAETSVYWTKLPLTANEVNVACLP